MLVSRRSSGEISHHGFRDLPGLLLPGDLLVVNTTATLPAEVRAATGWPCTSPARGPDGAWLVELRQIKDKISMPNGPAIPGQLISLPGGAVLTLEGKATARLWRARLSVAVVPYLLRHGLPDQVLLRAAATGRCRPTRRCSRASRAARRCRAPAARSRRPWSPGWWPAGC